MTTAEYACSGSRAPCGLQRAAGRGAGSKMERKAVLMFPAAAGPVQGNGVAVFILILCSGRSRKETPRGSGCSLGAPEMGPAHRVYGLPATIPNPAIGAQSDTAKGRRRADPEPAWGKHRQSLLIVGGKGNSLKMESGWKSRDVIYWQ
jgi:hypothetical protein